RRVFQKENSRACFIDKLGDHPFLIAMEFDQIPFVQNNNRCFAFSLDQTSDSFVLRGYACRKIDNKNAEISAADASFSADDAENFNRARTFAASADSSSVDEQKLLTIPPIRNVDGVASRSRHLADDRPLALYNGIDE